MDDVDPISLDIVDAQVHVFYRTGVEGALASMDALGIQSVIIDEIWSYVDKSHTNPSVNLANGTLRPVSPLAMAASLQYPHRFSFMQRVERLDPDIEALMQVLARAPGCRAIRLDLRSDDERREFATGGYDRLLTLAQSADLAVNLLAPDVHQILTPVAKRFPATRFVLDHCGSPSSLQAWRTNLGLASLKNVWMRWSSPHNYFDYGPYPFEPLNAPLREALQAFGPSRLLWAGDYTHNRSNAAWAQLLFWVVDNAGLTAGEKRQLLGQTAREVYKWPLATVSDTSLSR